MDVRTDQCVFLRYALGYKGVICYHRPKKRLIISRHIIHDEQTFPFHEGSATTYVQEVAGMPTRHHHVIVPYVLLVSTKSS